MDANPRVIGVHGRPVAIGRKRASIEAGVRRGPAAGHRVKVTRLSVLGAPNSEVSAGNQIRSGSPKPLWNRNCPGLSGRLVQVMAKVSKNK